MAYEKLTNPPVVEFSLGVQFAPLARLGAGHLGRFWNTMNLGEWTDSTDEQPLEDQFELFDKPRWSVRASPRLRFFAKPPVRRMRLMHESREKMIQLQATRLHFNWLKTLEFKPSYGSLIAEFLEIVRKFAEFVDGAGVGKLAPNQWELTYVDAFFQDEDWTTPADWKFVLPGLFGALFSDGEGEELVLDYRNAEWSFEIPPKRGRVHMSARPGRWSRDKRSALILTTTARGPLEGTGVEEMRAGLDIGHEKAVSVFFKSVDKRLLEKWR
jgi:uncharacterized protein (TIGR04255 family)